MNQSKNLYLVRHALATHSKRGYGKRRFTASILPEGIPAIMKMAHVLKDIGNSVNISSEVIRCRETSAIISRISGKKFIFDKRLNEGGYKETGEEIRERVHHFLNDMSHFSQTNMIICTHGKIIAAIKNLILNGTFLTKDLYDYPLTGKLIIIKGKTVKTINFN